MPPILFLADARHHNVARRLLAICALLAAGAAQAASPPATACALAAAPPSDTALVDVPFDIVDGRIYVAARVDDAGPFRFAVDTGASGIARADTRLVRALDLPRNGVAANSDGVHVAQADTTRLRTLALGELRHDDVDVLARDYNAQQSSDAAFDGILARGFFADGLLEIDYPKQRLRFRRDAGLSASQPDTLGYTRAFRIPVHIGTVETQAQLDTGANVAFVLPAALYAQVSDAPVADAPLTLTQGKVDGGRARVDVPFRIGGLTLPSLEVRVSSRYPEAVVGAHALRDAVVLIDQRSRRVAICPAQRGEEVIRPPCWAETPTILEDAQQGGRADPNAQSSPLRCLTKASAKCIRQVGTQSDQPR
ncbi:retropepsin-like aspartic protease [Luteimonas sp. FCS-9]|uniref:retropepsin-like aspartic protease n=1 Tax=Luteimonas sp. FCS-9 TaxID=1547516 RepID=UPI0009E1D4CA|nr:retropepsin-like aspartic protease [Luteimonas sp. FCS-9]